MRHPPVRIWMMMVGVALLGVVFATCSGLRRRQANFRWIAAQHRARMASICIENAVGGPLYFDTHGHHVTLEADEWHDLLVIKYDHAAAHPWLPVKADPPPPSLKDLLTTPEPKLDEISGSPFDRPGIRVPRWRKGKYASTQIRRIGSQQLRLLVQAPSVGARWGFGAKVGPARRST
jgi:hypothetical protein